MTECESKKPKKALKIGTHSGKFHCDEALACFMLKLLPEYTAADIVRTRDPQLLSACDIVVDVGAVYDPTAHRYDHHQKEFEETFSSLKPIYKNYNIKLSSAGLVYVHFGERIIAEKVSPEAVPVLYEKVYEHLIKEIDAIDNGVSICQGEANYRITSDVSSRVQRLNPNWNSAKEVDTDALFKEAMAVVGAEFLDRLTYFSQIWWPARDLVERAIKDRLSVHASGQIIELTNCVPWKEHLFDLEKILNIENTILYAIFQDQSGTWRVQGVPIRPNSFEGRKFLKKEWRGFRDEHLVALSGIPGCIFCHTTGFIGGNSTREGALQMAVGSLLAES